MKGKIDVKHGCCSCGHYGAGMRKEPCKSCGGSRFLNWEDANRPQDEVYMSREAYGRMLEERGIVF